MGTVTAFGARRPTLGAVRGDGAKLSASPPRGVIGAALFLLVSLFLLAAGGTPSLPDRDSPIPHPAGAVALDPSTSPAAG